MQASLKKKTKVWMLQSYLEAGIIREIEGERGGEGKRGQDQARGRWGWWWEKYREGQEIEQRCVAVGDGELGGATGKSQMLGKQGVPRTETE